MRVERKRKISDAEKAAISFCQGWATRDLQLGARLALLETETRDTGDANIEGKRVSNVPNVKAVLSADYALHGVKSLSVNGAGCMLETKSSARTA